MMKSSLLLARENSHQIGNTTGTGGTHQENVRQTTAQRFARTALTLDMPDVRLILVLMLVLP